MNANLLCRRNCLAFETLVQGPEGRHLVSYAPEGVLKHAGVGQMGILERTSSTQHIKCVAAITDNELASAFLAGSSCVAPVDVAPRKPRRARPGRHRDPKTGVMVLHCKHYALRIYPQEMDWLQTQATLRTQTPKKSKSQLRRSEPKHGPVTLRFLEVSRLLLVVGLGEWRLPWWRLPIPCGSGNKTKLISVTIDDDEWDTLVQRAGGWCPEDPDPVRFCLEAALGRVGNAECTGDGNSAEEEQIPVLLTGAEYATLARLRTAVLLAQRCHPAPAITPALEQSLSAILSDFERSGSKPEDCEISAAVENNVKCLEADLEQGLSEAEAIVRWQAIQSQMNRIGGQL